MNATTVLGWSIEEFWSATPRMYYACFYSFIDMQVTASKKAVEPQALVGKDAIEALAGMARYIR